MSNYPRVIGEFETVRKIAKGFSIARFGDGEIKLMEKNVYTRELAPVPGLAKELRIVMRDPDPRCLIGIPTMDPAGSKYEHWSRMRERIAAHLPLGRKYYSAFISRPDSGTAWLETREYYEAVCKIWARKRRITVVCEASSKLLDYLRLAHGGELVHIECPTFGAYAHIRRFEREVLQSGCDLALLACGVTATALAHRLCRRGVHVVDIGSIGGFLLRWRCGGPKPASYAEERTNA